MITSFAEGFKRTVREKRLVIIFYVTNVVAGLVVALPLRSMLNDFAGSSLMSNVVAGGFNADFFFEFLSNNATGIKLLTGLILVVALLFWIIGLFLSGGAMSVLLSNEKFRREIFWSNSAKYFGRFFRLWLFSIPVFLLLYCTQFIETLVVLILYGSDPYQNIAFWGGIIRVGLGYIAIVLYYTIFDYARIYVIKNDERSMGKAIWKSISFTFQNIVRTFGLSSSIFIIGLGALFLSQVATSTLSGRGTMVILTLIIVQQIFIFIKVGLKIVLYSSQIDLYGKLATDQPVIVPKMPEIPVTENPAPTPDTSM